MWEIKLSKQAPLLVFIYGKKINGYYRMIELPMKNLEESLFHHPLSL